MCVFAFHSDTSGSEEKKGMAGYGAGAHTHGRGNIWVSIALLTWHAITHTSQNTTFYHTHETSTSQHMTATTIYIPHPHTYAHDMPLDETMFHITPHGHFRVSPSLMTSFWDSGWE